MEPLSTSITEKDYATIKSYSENFLLMLLFESKFHHVIPLFLYRNFNLINGTIIYPNHRDDYVTIKKLIA